jgi:hypothetical protein
VRLHAFNRIDLLPELGELGTSFSRRRGVGIVVLLFVLFIVVITLVPASSFSLTLGENRSALSVEKSGM